MDGERGKAQETCIDTLFVIYASRVSPNYFHHLGQYGHRAKGSRPKAEWAPLLSTGPLHPEWTVRGSPEDSSTPSARLPEIKSEAEKCCRSEATANLLDIVRCWILCHVVVIGEIRDPSRLFASSRRQRTVTLSYRTNSSLLQRRLRSARGTSALRESALTPIRWRILPPTESRRGVGQLRWAHVHVVTCPLRSLVTPSWGISLAQPTTANCLTA